MTALKIRPTGYVTGVHVPETCYRSDTYTVLLQEPMPPVYISSLSPSLFSVP